MITKRQRREINRKNAARSTGPTSIEGKDRSRRNALKHGLRAETILLPTEDLADLQDRFDDWNDYYGPDSPGEQFLITRAVYYGIQLDRCAAHHAALVAQQIRHALHDAEVRTGLEIEALRLELMDEPALAAERLRHTAAGCQWLIRSYNAMAQIVREGRFWDAGERAIVHRLGGICPVRDGLVNTDVGLALEASRALFEPRIFETEENAAEWAELRGKLVWFMDEEIAALRAREAQLRREIEDPDRAEAVARALLPEGPQAALYQRYERMYELGFQRVYKEILKAIALAEKAEKDGELDDDHGAAEQKAPNEANGVGEEQISSNGTRTSESASGQNPTVVAGDPAPASMVSGDADDLAPAAAGPDGVSGG